METKVIYNNNSNDLFDMGEIEALLAEQKEVQEHGQKLIEQTPKIPQLEIK